MCRFATAEKMYVNARAGRCVAPHTLVCCCNTTQLLAVASQIQKKQWSQEREPKFTGGVYVCLFLCFLGLPENPSIEIISASQWDKTKPLFFNTYDFTI